MNLPHDGRHPKQLNLNSSMASTMAIFYCYWVGPNAWVIPLYFLSPFHRNGNPGYSKSNFRKGNFNLSVNDRIWKTNGCEYLSDITRHIIIGKDQKKNVVVKMSRQ